MSTIHSMPSNAFVDFKEVKSRVSILQVLERYDLTRTLKRSADRLSGPCPLHRGTNPTQFRVSASKNCWNCFGACGRGGNVIDFVSMREAVPFRDAALLLQEWFMPEKSALRVAESASFQSHRSSPPAGPPPVTPVAAASSSDDDGEAGENPPLSFELKSLKLDHPYPASRGLSAALVLDYGIGFCSKGCLRGYLAIPIRNREGKLVAYIGRWPGDPPEDKPKYKLPKGFKKSLEVFNLDRAAKEPGDHALLVVEGVFDCLRLVQLGYPRTVALLGSSLSKRQEALLCDAAGRGGQITLLFDADEAGRRGAADAAARLSRHCTVRNVDIGEFRHQPEHLEKQELEALHRNR
ncbi:MAG: toprim domain-containing protein [Verrucomicrobiaceae bacterium]|nr:toprim domain-containing protein [Verrucomicrobiaceae bacterium]